VGLPRGGSQPRWRWPAPRRPLLQPSD
jgi:hypothetical protein